MQSIGEQPHDSQQTGLCEPFHFLLNSFGIPYQQEHVSMTIHQSTCT